VFAAGCGDDEHDALTTGDLAGRTFQATETDVIVDGSTIMIVFTATSSVQTGCNTVGGG
jgi:hypothetical protein